MCCIEEKRNADRELIWKATQARVKRIISISNQEQNALLQFLQHIVGGNSIQFSRDQLKMLRSLDRGLRRRMDAWMDG